MDIYNNTIIHYIDVFNFKRDDLNYLRKIIFTKCYNLVELLIQTPNICKKTDRHDSDELLKLNMIVGELNNYYKYSFIEMNYISLIEFIIKKNFKKSINITSFCNKLHEPEIETNLNNLSVCKIGNYLSS